MIRLLQEGKRRIFTPTGLLNDLVRWTLGVHSSNGTVAVVNTATPAESRSLDLTVDAGRTYAEMSELMDRDYVRADKFPETLRKSIDNRTLTMGKGVVAVDETWLENFVADMINKYSH